MAGGIAVTLVCLVGLLRGHVWAWAPGAVGAAVALREIRVLQRARG